MDFQHLYNALRAIEQNKSENNRKKKSPDLNDQKEYK